MDGRVLKSGKVVKGILEVVDGDVGTCKSRVSLAQFRAGAG